MDNYTIFIDNCQPKSVYYIHAKAVGDGFSWMDYDLPTPALFKRARSDNSYYIAWAIDGYFGTHKGREAVNDIKARIAVSLNAEILPYPPQDFSIVQNVAKLRDFKGLQRVRNNGWRKHVDALEALAKSDKRTKKEKIISDDRLFDALRFPAYELVKLHGKKALNVEWLEEIGNQCKDSFGKSYSDVKGKAKAIYAWVIENYSPGGRWADWTLEERAQYRRNYRQSKKRDDDMTRAESAKKATEFRQKIVKEKVQNVINDYVLGYFQDQKLTAKLIAKEAGIAVGTAQKYFKQFKQASKTSS